MTEIKRWEIVNKNRKSRSLKIFTEPGTGRKKCPKCSYFIGAASKKCLNCNYIFENIVKVNEDKKQIYDTFFRKKILYKKLENIKNKEVIDELIKNVEDKINIKQKETEELIENVLNENYYALKEIVKGPTIERPFNKIEIFNIEMSSNYKKDITLSISISYDKSTLLENYNSLIEKEKKYLSNFIEENCNLSLDNLINKLKNDYLQNIDKKIKSISWSEK